LLHNNKENPLSTAIIKYSIISINGYELRQNVSAKISRYEVKSKYFPDTRNITNIAYPVHIIPSLDQNTFRPNAAVIRLRCVFQYTVITIHYKYP